MTERVAGVVEETPAIEGEMCKLDGQCVNCAVAEVCEADIAHYQAEHPDEAPLLFALWLSASEEMRAEAEHLLSTADALEAFAHEYRRDSVSDEAARGVAQTLYARVHGAMRGEEPEPVITVPSTALVS